MGDPLNKQFFTARGSIIFPPKVANRPPWLRVSSSRGHFPMKEPRDPNVFPENKQNPRGNSGRCLKRTMVEENGKGINPQSSDGLFF